MTATIQQKEALKKAKKVMKRWYKVLLSTNLMNDENDRNDFAAALQTIKEHSK